MQATRLNKPILHTDDVRFCLLWGAEKGKCSFGEMKPVLRGVPGISGMARNQHVRYRFRVVAQSVLKFR